MEENEKVAIVGEGRPQMILYANGKAIGPIEDVEIATIEPAEGETRVLGIDLAQGADCTASFTFKPRFPRVNRKRFIQNLIKTGCPKKQAKKIAWKVQKDGQKSYSYANFLAGIAGWWNI